MSFLVTRDARPYALKPPNLGDDPDMNRNTEISKAIRRALLTGALTTALTALPAYAQDQDQDQNQEQADGDVQTVVVTGSRIPQPNLTSISPVTAVGSDEVKFQGTTRVEDLVNNLPQAFADFGGNISNGATGAATVNLRGLGSQRTLVLVNGRRLMPGDPTQNGLAAPDLNQIPTALVERIEVLTGGASAVYGADAVAGVVNFIMNDKFEGIRIDGQYSLYQHENDHPAGQIVEDRGFLAPDSSVRDGYTKDINFIAGVNTEDQRGNATIYVGYRELDAITQDERDFSACALASGAAAFTCGGSGTTAPSHFLPQPREGFPNSGGNFIVGADGNLRNYVTATDAYNFAPTNYYQRPDERKIAGLFAHYDVSDKARAYTEFMFMDDRSLAQIAPSGLFLGSGVGTPPFFGDYLINCANPFLNASMIQQFCTDAGLGVNDDFLTNIGRRNIEGGGRLADLRHTAFRTVLGFRGDITDTWQYDVAGQYGTTRYAQQYNNEFSLSRVSKALLAVTDANGNIVCRANADTDLSNDDPNCVPINIFSNQPIPQNALDYVQLPGFQDGSTIETIMSASVTGDLGRKGLVMPGASDGLGVAFGSEWRQEETDLRADAAFQTNDLLGQGAPTLDTSGRYDVFELFGEARLPILQDQPFAQSLSVEVGYRYSDYSLGFDTDTYKLGADWAPADSIRFRGSYQQAVRAPNLQELFLAGRVQLNGTTDPCAGIIGDDDPTDDPTATAEECARSGVTPAQYGQILANPAAQYNGFLAGNPNLDPESSDTVSFGFVFTPTFLDGFSLAADIFNITVEDLIGQVGQDLTLNQCLTTGEAQFCDLIHRLPTNGSIWLGSAGFIEDPIINTGSLETTGMDLEANYRLALGETGGRLAFQLIGTYIDELLVEPISGSPVQYDCVGFHGPTCGTPSPEWRHKLRATYTTPWNLDVSLSWRYIDEIQIDAASDDSDLTAAFPGTEARLGARSYLDLAAGYQWNKMSFRLGINNLLDKDPPIVGQAVCISTYCNGNTYPQVYDTLGRYVFAGLTADF
jgi:outer membrane receptor protein involved in Fe transport